MDVLRIKHADLAAVRELLARLGLKLQLVAPDAPIPGSFWGDCEAGLIGGTLYARSDTPLHSVLHEACHFACMAPSRREALHTNAGGDWDEENAVCYLQVLLADALPGLGRARLMADMDAWGYSFRLGSTAAWFAADGEGARQWLSSRGLLALAPSAAGAASSRARASGQ